MKRNITVAIGTLGLVAAGWAVTHAQERPDRPRPTPTPTPAQPQTEQMTEVCPVGLEGLQVQAMTIPEGGALQFVVQPAQVSELRTRLQRFARMHREQMQRGGGMGAGAGATGGGTTGGTTGRGATGGGAAGGGATAGARGMQFADTSALIHQARDVRIVEIPNGARLEVRMSRAPEQRVEDLRNELRQDAQQLTQGRCPLALQIES